MYAAAQEVDFNQQLWDTSKAVFQDTGGSDHENLFFLCGNGKAQILMANCNNWKAEAPQASVCWVCGCNRAQCLANFGLEDTILVGCGAPNWSDISTHCSRPPHSGPRVARGAACHYMWYLGHARRSGGSNGEVRGCVVRILFQPILDIARIQAKTATKGRLNNDKANGKGKVRLECAAVVQFMCTRRWEALTTMCLGEGGMNNKRVGGRLWGDVCREWWDDFAQMCVYAWQTDWLSGGKVEGYTNVV